MVVTVEEAGAKLHPLIQQARRGEEIVIAEGHQPIARLVSIPSTELQAKPHPQFGSGRGVFRMAPDFEAPLEDFREYVE